MQSVLGLVDEQQISGKGRVVRTVRYRRSLVMRLDLSLQSRNDFIERLDLLVLRLRLRSFLRPFLLGVGEILVEPLAEFQPDLVVS